MTGLFTGEVWRRGHGTQQDGRRRDRNTGAGERRRERKSAKLKKDVGDTGAQGWCGLLAFTESTLAETLLNSTIS